MRSMALLTLLISFSPLAMSKEYSEQALRTLFTDPQQRQEIDRNRSAGGSSGEQAVSGPSRVQINGMVKRSDGKNTVWVNGKNTMENATVDSVKVYSNAISSKNKVPVIIDGRKVYIKPGEAWSEEAGVSGVGD